MSTIITLLAGFVVTSPFWFVGSRSGARTNVPVVPWPGFARKWQRWTVWVGGILLAPVFLPIPVLNVVLFVICVSAASVAAWHLGAISVRGQQIERAPSYGDQLPWE